MSNLLDPQHWRAKAEEARAQAEQMVDASAGEILTELAVSYEAIAVRMEKRLRQARE